MRSNGDLRFLSIDERKSNCHWYGDYFSHHLNVLNSDRSWFHDWKQVLSAHLTKSFNLRFKVMISPSAFLNKSQDWSNANCFLEVLSFWFSGRHKQRSGRPHVTFLEPKVIIVPCLLRNCIGSALLRMYSGHAINTSDVLCKSFGLTLWHLPSFLIMPCTWTCKSLPYVTEVLQLETAQAQRGVIGWCIWSSQKWAHMYHYNS